MDDYHTALQLSWKQGKTIPSNCSYIFVSILKFFRNRSRHTNRSIFLTFNCFVFCSERNSAIKSFCEQYQMQPVADPEFSALSQY